jgi:FkbM family methyltransferase
MTLYKWFKNTAKGIYVQTKRLKVIRRLRYSNFGWKIYFFYFSRIKQITDNEFDLYEILNKKVDGILAFDIGANRGINTSHLLKLGYSVVAVEPESSNFEALQIRYASNPKLHLVNKAISNVKGEQSLFVEKGDSLHTLSDKWKKAIEKRFEFEVEFQASQKVMTLTLDDLIRKYGVPDFLKVDVEGHELEVFSGLSSAIPMIIFEANLPEFLRETEEIIEKLKNINADYQFEYYQNGKILPISTKFFKEMDGRKSIEIICWLVKSNEKKTVFD